MFDQLAELDAKLESRTKCTTIVKIAMTPSGQFCVGRNTKPIEGFLNKEQIEKVIPEVEFAPVSTEDPFFFTVHGRQRLVFTLAMDSWFFQPTIAPFTLKTPDPLNNFVNLTKLNDDPYGLGRSKTIYVDDNNKVAEEKPYEYNLFIDMWQEPKDPASARTPVVIDPRVRNDNGG